MPSPRVDCPACDAGVRVPDGATAVACPECGHKIKLGGAKPPAGEPATKTTKAPAAAADVKDVPRKKKKKKAAAAAGMDPFTKRLVGYGVAGVIALGGVVGSWLGFGGKGKDRGADPDVAAVTDDTGDPADDAPKAGPKGKGKDKGKGRPNPRPEPKEPEPKAEEPKVEYPPQEPMPKEAEPKVEEPPPPKKEPPKKVPVEDEIAIKLPDPPKIRVTGSVAPKAGGPPVARPPATPPLAEDEDPFVRAKRFRPDGPLPTLPKLPPAAQRPLLTLDSGGHSAFVKNAFITPKGDRVVTVGEDKAVRVWDIRTGDPVHTLRLPAGPGDEGSLLAAALSPNGKRLAVAGVPLKGVKGGAVPVFLVNVETGTVWKTLNTAREVVTCLDFSADGNKLAAGCADGTVQLFDVATGNPAGEVVAHLGGVREVRFNPNPKARVLATIGTDRTVRVYDLANPGRNVRVTNPDFGPTCIDWTADGNTLAVGGTAGEVSVFSREGKLLRNLPAHSHGGEKVQIFRMQFLAGDTALACGGVGGGAGGWAGVRAADTGAVKVAFTSHSNTVMAVNVSADGKRVVSSGGNQNETYVWDANDGKVVSRLCGLGNGIWGVGWARDGKSLAFGTDNEIAPNGTRKLEFTFRLDDFGAGGVPEEARYEQGLRDDGTYRWERVGQNEVGMGPTASPVGRVFRLPGGERIYSATLLPGRRMLVVGGAFSQVLVDPHDGKVVRTFTGHTGHVLSVAPSPDGKYFVTGSSDQTIRVWLPDQEEPLLSVFVAGRDWIAWTPQGFYACSGHGERLIAWQVNAGAYKVPQVHPAGRFRPSLYQPAIVKYLIPAGSLSLALAMAEKYDKALVRTTSVADIVPPEVTLESPAPPAAKDGKEEPPLTTDANTVVVKASAKGAAKQPVTAMRLLVDGRPFQGSAGVRRFDVPRPEATATWEVPLTPGPHSFAVIAETGVAKGMSKVAVLTRSGEVPKPNLYVLAVGVSDYPGDMKLRYAASDARLLAKAFEDKSKGVFASVQVKVLTDAQATRKGIREGLDWMKGVMTAKDVGVVSFSGHGVRDPLNRFYLVPADVSEADPAGTCLPGDEFKSRLEDMPGRLVAILDACHSGGVVEKARPPARADGLVRDLVSEDAGVVVMCASLGREYAIESRLTKAGFFTLGLVEGMSGHGDVDGDGVVYIHELDLYATARVVQLSGGRQTPTTARPAGIRPFAIAKP